MRGGIEGLEFAIHGTVPLAQPWNATDDAIVAHNQVLALSPDNTAMHGPTARLGCKVQCVDGTLIQEGAVPKNFDAMDVV